jgi:hypothetical protein
LTDVICALQSQSLFCSLLPLQSKFNPQRRTHSLPPAQLLRAIGFLNKHGFAHLDIKRENIVLEPIDENDDSTFNSLFSPLPPSNQAALDNIRVRSAAAASLRPRAQIPTGEAHRFRSCHSFAALFPAHPAVRSQH